MSHFEIVAQFGLSARSVEVISGGLINQSYRVETEDHGVWVLQCVNSIFRPEVQLDIDAVTAHLQSKHLVTPLLRPTVSGGLWFTEGRRIWRMMNFIEGRCIHRIERPVHARAAGRILAQFHAALEDLDHEFHAERPAIHDTSRHIKHLETTLDSAEFQSHEHRDSVGKCAEQILGMLQQLPSLPSQEAKVVHGDPKISNIIFDAAHDHAICMIDLDTVGRMPSLFELGDAFRSWCNPAATGEDDPKPEFSLDLFEAAVSAYASAAANYLNEAERAAIPYATLQITLELATRFAADALRESYFGWDKARFASRGHHNLRRAQGQLGLAKSLSTQLDSARSIVTHAFEHAKG